jgi:hypothetical protein
MISYDSESSVTYDNDYDSDTTITDNINSYICSYSFMRDNSVKNMNNSLYSNMSGFSDNRYNSKSNSRDNSRNNSKSNSRSNSRDNSRDNSRNNSYENKFLENMMIENLRIANIKSDRFQRLQKKNTKLKHKIVLEELKRNKINVDLYKEKYNRVMDQIIKINLENIIYKSKYETILHELLYKNSKIYKFGEIYIDLIKSLE